MTRQEGPGSGGSVGSSFIRKEGNHGGDCGGGKNSFTHHLNSGADYSASHLAFAMTNYTGRMTPLLQKRLGNAKRLRYLQL